MGIFININQMMKMRFTDGKSLMKLCTILFLLIFSAMGVSMGPIWSANSDIKAGTLTITTNGNSYGGFFTVPYSTPFQVTPNVGIAIPTLDIMAIPNPMLWKCNLPQSSHRTQFKLSVHYVSTRFLNFRVSYLAVSNTLSYLKVDYLEVGEAFLGPLLNGQGPRSITHIKQLGITVNSSSNLSIIPYVSGLKISSKSEARQFQLTFAKNHDKSVFWTATCYGTTTVTEIVAYMLFYDITLGEATQELFLDYKPITGTHNMRDPVELLFFNQTNLLVGATSFNFTHGFSFNIEPKTLELTSPSPAHYQNILFSFWSFRKRNCLSQTPFFEKITNLCYDMCPEGYLAIHVPTRYCESCSSYMPHCVYCPQKNVCHKCETGYMVNASSSGCTCDTGYYMIEGSCLSTCPDQLWGDEESGTCLDSCPQGKYSNQNTRNCVTQCPSPLFAQPLTLSCATLCPSGFYGNPDNHKCVTSTSCSLNYFGDDSTRMCVTQCPAGTFGDSSSQKCVTQCNSPTFADISTQKCTIMCSANFYGEPNTRKCVTLCPVTPVTHFGLDASRMCVTECPTGFYKETSSRKCVTECPDGFFTQDNSQSCMTQCPAGYFGDSMNGRCVLQCPDSYFGDSNSKTCVQQCPDEYFGDHISKNCAQQCPDEYYGQNIKRTCVIQCPQTGFYRQNSTKLCVSNCKNEQNSYADDSNGYCVFMCSTGTWADPTTHKCVSQCPIGYFQSSSVSSCVQACPVSTYAEPTTRRCVSSCPTSSIPEDSTRTCKTCSDGTWTDTATNTCAACAQSCKTCAGSATNCTSCETTRTLTSPECTCNSGIEDQNGQCVSQCTQVGCDLCPTDNKVCEKCKESFILSGGRCHCPSNSYYSIEDVKCYSCSSTCAICSGPSSKQCTGCHSSQNREINITSFACDCRVTFYSPNNQNTCIKEPSTTCPQNYVYNSTSGYCVEVCGDGKLFELECDDGNLQNGDGCDSNCKVQTNFGCLYGDSQSPSICSYQGQITFQLIFAEKDMFGNLIRLEYNLIPQLKFYERFPNFTNTIRISDPTLNIENAYFSSQSKILQVQLSFNETATDKVVSITYTPTSSPYSHALTSTSYDWPVRVGNGLSLTYFHQGVYDQARLYDYVTLGIYIGSLFVYVLALFFRKMIGVQIIILIQTQVLSLTLLNEIHPILGVLTKEKYAFGYNQFEDLMNLKTADEGSVGLYSVIGFSQIFGENVNVMFFAICVFYFLAILIGGLSTCKQKVTAKRMKEAALILARQIAFGLLLFSLMNMITSYALETFAGSIWKYEPEYSGVIKIGSIIIIAANYGVYGLYFKESVESYVFYEKRSRTAQLQPLFIATKAMLIAAGIALYQHFGINVLYGLMGLQGAYIILIMMLRPFKRRVDLFRSLILELSLLYIVGSRYVLIEFVQLDKPGDWKNFLEYGLIGQHGLVGFSLLLSLISLVFHLFKANKSDAQISPEDAHSQYELEEEKQKQKRYSKNSNSTHYPIQDYLENYLEDEDRRNASNNRKNKLYFENDLKNNSMAQLINISDGDGYDSKRKLKNKSMAHSMEIIQMDD